PFSALPSTEDGNILVPNTLNIVQYQANTRTTDLILHDDVDAYHQVTSGYATTATNSLLVVPAGTVWKFGASAGLAVNGAIIVDGNIAEKVIFTSDRDDTGG